MDILAFVLVAVGAVFAAIYNVYTKKVQTEDWKNRTGLLTALHFGGAGVIMLLISVMTGGPTIEPGFFLPMLATGLFNIVISYAKMRARALEDVSLVAPIDSTTPAAVIITSMIILGEYPSPLGWLGIWLLMVGTYALSFQDFKKMLAEREKDSGRVGWRKTVRIWFAPFFALGRSKGVRWAFVAVILSTFTLNWDGLVARRADVGFGFGCVCVIIALGNLPLAFWRREHVGVKAKAALEKSAPLILSLATTIFITSWAFRYDIVPYVGSLKRISIPMTIILAYYIVHERKSFKERIVGGAIMAVGAVLITLGGH